MDVLKTIGYEPVVEKGVTFSERLVPLLHGYAFRMKSHATIDLHWHILQECLQEDDDRDFWQDSVPVLVENRNTRTLNASDQILHLCVHGSRWTTPSSIRWIADVMTVLHSNAMVDWNRLVFQCNRRRLMMPVCHALAYLRHEYRAPVPIDVLNDLAAPSKTEISEFRYRTKDRRKILLGHLPSLWYSYKRNSKDSGPLGFIEFARRFWGVESRVLIPFYVLKKFLRRVFLAAYKS